MNILAVSESKTLDPAAIERLCRLGGGKFAAEMIELFLSYGGKKIAETRLAQQAGNLAEVANAAHPIKSSAGNVGAVRVQEQAALVEQLAKEAKRDALVSQVDELERTFAEAKARLEMEKSKLQPGSA